MSVSISFFTQLFWHISSMSTTPKPPGKSGEMAANFNCPRVKYSESLTQCSNKNLTDSDSGVPHRYTRLQTRVLWTYQPDRQGRALRLHNRHPQNGEAVTDSMRRFCGLFTGIKSSIYTQWPAIACISWASQRSVAPKIWVNLLSHQSQPFLLFSNYILKGEKIAIR